jgi:ribosomal protein S18 acetylase RimI-like enzyme
MIGKQILRAAVPDDQPFLWQMLYYAAHMDESGESSESARTNPDLSPYVEGFGRSGDFGVIAVDTATGVRIGAAWIRQMPAMWPLYHFVAAVTPELEIAVRPAHIGRGAGSLMRARLLSYAAATHSSIVLSVRANNPAKTLYERLGFDIVAQITNRVGGKSFIMKIELTPSR